MSRGLRPGTVKKVTVLAVEDEQGLSKASGDQAAERKRPGFRADNIPVIPSSHPVGSRNAGRGSLGEQGSGVGVVQVRGEERHGVIDVRDRDGLVDGVDVARRDGEGDDGDAGPEALD